MLVSIGCVEALNLDGGGSSCLLVNGKETIRPSDKEGQRAIPGIFYIANKK
jgi:exopolysaccharide biosynthesis protein